MAAMLVCGLVTPAVAAEPLEFVAEDSTIEFVGTKTDGKHEGGFKKCTAKAMADWENPEKGSLEIEIDTSSLWSDHPKLTNHLKSPDFFDVRKHSGITFESTKIIPGGEGAATIVGDLTMLGETAEVQVPVKAAKVADKLRIAATFVIDRTKWGMTYGEGKIDKKVKIDAELMFKR